MPESDRALAVWCFGRLAGTLLDADGGLAFTYDADWLADRMPPLSQSLPLTGDYDSRAVAAFFAGLLPEGVPRELLARRLGVSVGNDFGLLAAVGGDTAGAISLQVPGEQPGPAGGDVEWLGDGELITLIDELPSRPMHADADGEYRLSLAGAQDKLPVVLGQDRRIGLTKGQTPSTHILKTRIERLPDTVVNEAFCLALGRALRIETVTATPHRVGDREFLLVERYDRSPDGDAVRRLHQEDFCQALGIPTARKYEAEGGPSLADCFALLRRATEVPAREIVKLVDYVALSFLVGNHDAHGKNYSLLYVPGASEAVLAPAYDIISTFAYHRTHDLTRKMAMKLGGQYKPDYVEHRHLERFLEDAGLGAAAARRRLRAHASRAPSAAREVRERLAADGWDGPTLDVVIEIVDQRAARLADLTSPPSNGRVAPRVRPGQRWRDSRNPDDGVWVITVEEVKDGTVGGTVREQASDREQRGSWRARDFERFALLSDPDWPTHLIAARVDLDDPRAVSVTKYGGEIEGVRSQTVAAGGLGGPETCWRIIAPTESDALGLVMRLVGRETPVRAALGWHAEP